MTRLSGTVAGLGTPETDGEIGVIRVGSYPDTWDELLVWNAGQQAWVGRPHYSMKHIHQREGMISAGNLSTWGYPFNTTGASAIDNGYGFQIHANPFGKALWDAGLRIQENLSAIIRNQGDGTQQPNRMGLNWYYRDPGDDFLSPLPENFGVELVNTDPNNVVKHRKVTGWRNSPLATPDASIFYPELYTRGYGFHFYEFTGRYRWVAGVLGSNLPADGSADQPPLFTHLMGWYTADSVPVEDGAPVTTWPSYDGRFGTGGDVERASLIASGTSRPTLVKNAWNGRAVVRFDGINDFMRAIFSGPNQPLTFVMVLKQYAAGSSPQVWLSGHSSAPLLYRADDTNQVNFWGGSAPDITYDRPSNWPMEKLALVVTANGASSTIHENKTLRVSGDASGLGINGLCIGCRGSDQTLHAQIDVAEILVYYKALSQAEREALVDWLDARYDLT